MHELIENALDRLAKDGWASFCIPSQYGGAMEKTSLEIAHSIGVPSPSRRRGPMIDHLSPVNRQVAKTRSLSARYGLGEFPWHTDGAHWCTPPRYLVMGCLEADEKVADTIICDGHLIAPLSSAAARSAVFRVTNGGNSFYASVRPTLGHYFRYDPGCMTPLDDRALAMINAMDHQLPEREVRIGWTKGKYLLLDNWRFLHRREATAGSTTRKLIRVTVMENN
ncbi:TauD/TfdA family dioxygenase [Pseudomonas lijiangensis]|jgi:alpha-ketoglutarate-dependent taurine dioxygenase|uniref:TauD/TfdA family dioxygenase n=1 Tax=Pseudomonas lijiangensis TaxID=2995658 RepID=UPI0031BAEDB5